MVPTLRAWKAAGKTLAIFSSGSVQAQLQFFSYVKEGPNATIDIKPLFSAHYDTVNAGPKTHAASYTKICSELGYSEQKVAFLTDNVKGMYLLVQLLAMFALKQHTTRLTCFPSPPRSTPHPSPTLVQPITTPLHHDMTAVLQQPHNFHHTA